MLLTTIRTAFTDRFTSETVDQSRLTRLIASAVSEYSRYNPRLRSTTLSTVADQVEYNLPSDCLWVLECYWWPMGEMFAELRAGAEQAYILQHPSRYHMVSDRVIDDINQSEHIQRTIARWEQRNKILVLGAEPSAGGTDDIALVYAAKHEINAGSTGYDTLPDEDLAIMADLTLSIYLQSRSAELALEPDWAEGLQRVTHHFASANLQAVIVQLRQALEGKYGGSVMGLVR